MSEGKTDSWLNLAVQFNILPNASNKQRSDKVRKLYNSIDWGKVEIPTVEMKMDYTSNPNWIVDNTYVQDVVYNDGFYNRTTIKNKEWDEFRKWKESKNIQPVKRSEDGMHIVIGCTHCPYENQELVVKLCSFISDYKHKIAGFHLIGDFMNMGALSPHNDKTVDLTGYTLGQEYLAGNKLLDIFDSVLPKNIRKTYLGGNHEFWYDRYVSNIKNFKTADALPSPYDALKLVQRGYEVKTDWKEDFFIVGSYHLIHGLYCSTNPCKAHIDKLRQNVLFAHTHRIGQHFEGKLHGMNIGTFADINSEGFKYSSRIERQAWNNGFGIISVSGNESQAELIVCNNNSFYYAGKKY